jgi:glycosyltransferase involved in cell wall biosynthesis
LIGDFRQIDYIRKAVKDFKYSIYSTGINMSTFKLIGKNEARELLGLDKNKKYILYVGKLYKYKQVKELIEIWNEIKKTRPEIELMLVGNEPRSAWGEEYYDMAVEFGAKIIGRVLNTELYKYYSAADVYVMLGLRDDMFGGTGIAPLESLACNTPIVSSAMRNYLGNNAEEICEIPDSLEGYKKAILKVIDHRENYKNMRESVEKYYSHEALVKRADKIFTEVLEKKY